MGLVADRLQAVAAAIISDKCLFSSGITCAYTSRVIWADECPSWRLTYRIAPEVGAFCKTHVAHECLKACVITRS